MLAHLVRPLVCSQLQMLAQTQSAGSKLVGMVSQWLGYLGVQAEVTRLRTEGERIQVSLHVAKPDQCSEDEWRQILNNVTHGGEIEGALPLTYATMPQSQKRKVHQLLGAVLEASGNHPADAWEQTRLRLLGVGIESSMVEQLRSAVRAPQSMEVLVQDLEPEVAAYVLSKAISITLFDRHINQAEDDALRALLEALEHQAKD